MPTSPRLIVANWKMHGVAADIAAARVIAAAVHGASADVEVALCVPATLIERLHRALMGSSVTVGGQDLHDGLSGPFTGDVSAAMLADAGAEMVIVGHSERRAAYGEDDARVAVKARAAVVGGLVPIICVGETAMERDTGQTLAIIRRQVIECVPPDLAAAEIVLAYEPVWAVGTGAIPDLHDVAAAHATLRSALNEVHEDLCRSVRLLFGGSVDAGNASRILDVREVDGVLVGGASRVAGDFISLLRSSGVGFDKPC